MKTSEDVRLLRGAFAQYATGVAIVTAVEAGGKCVGMTINSFSSVSLEPPLILFSVANSAHSLAVFLTAEHYAVNVLHQGQVDLCSRFARPLGDKWSGRDWAATDAGAPVISDALAIFECKRYAVHEGGDHKIIIGEVERFSRPFDGDPLIFFRGNFHLTAAPIPQNVCAGSPSGD